MKILLIGASGMIGSRILNEAISRGHNVLAAGRNPEKISTGDTVTAISLDVNDASAVVKASADVDLVISAVSPATQAMPFRMRAASQRR